MNEQGPWARTDEQVARLQEARSRGGLCADCGRELDDGEPVFLERIPVGARRPWLGAPVRPRGQAIAPVGRECASPELLRHAEGREPEPCVRCRRSVVDARPRPAGRRVTCSRRCAGYDTQVRTRGVAPGVVRERVPRPKKATPERKAASTERFGTRLKRLRESRGMARSELAEACTGPWRRLVGEDDITRLENGGPLPRLRTFAALSLALGVSMEVLLYGEEEAARIATERSTVTRG